jgi:ABC-type multidrug transport system ATPase subunit
MMTGMIAPSSGDVNVNGFSLRENVNNVRQSLGLCQQFDVLFDKLTVTEHL